MPFSILPFRHLTMHFAATYNIGLFQGQDTNWNLSCNRHH